MKPLAKEASKIRLQVFLSHSGACSRRKALEFIFQGKVTVNGKKVCEPSYAVDPAKDNVCFQGEPVLKPVSYYILLNKPKGFVTTVCDKFAEKTVLDLIPKNFHGVYPVGRLDKETSGLLLLTNDGDFAYRLTHPKFDIDKTYHVVVQGILESQAKRQLEQGVVIDRKKTAPCRIANLKFLNKKTQFLITIHEGRKRQIRRMLSKVGYRVLDLQRIQQGSLRLGALPCGRWRFLDKKEVSDLKRISHKR